MKIEKDVPIPVERRYPLGQMEIDNSLFFPGELGKAAPANAAQHHRRKSGKQFITREVENGWRLWRIK